MTSIGGVGTLSSEDLPLLQQRPFRMLSFTRFTSRAASNAINFALVLLIVDETGRAFMSSLLVLALIIPATVMGLLAGVTADAFPRRAIIFLADVARSLLCVAAVLADKTVGLYFAMAILLATLAQFAASAEGSILPSVVSRDRLAQANAIGHAVAGLAQIVGFVVLAPVALRVFDSPDSLFAVSAGFFGVAAIQALLIGRVARPASVELAPTARGSWWAAGWLEVRREPLVTRAVVELTLISAAIILLGGLIPTFIQDTLRLPVEIGALVLLPAAGGIVVGLRLAGYLAHRVPHGLLSSTGFTGFVALLLAVAFARPLAAFLGGYSALSWMDSVDVGSFDSTGLVVMVLVVPAGFCYALVSVAAQTVINEQVPLHMQGRVLATQGALAALASSLPVLVAGALADVVGVTAVLAGLAVVIGIAASANLWRPRRSSPKVVGVRRAN